MIISGNSPMAAARAALATERALLRGRTLATDNLYTAIIDNLPPFKEPETANEAAHAAGIASWITELVDDVRLFEALVGRENPTTNQMVAEIVDTWPVTAAGAPPGERRHFYKKQ